MEMSYKPGHLPQIRPTIEEELRRDVTCPKCGLEHAVFGLASWCPDCGAIFFLSM
jgi:ribosomal protein S27E